MSMTKSGSRCGRWVTDGSLPALCHKHKPNAPAVGIIPPEEAIDEVKILRKLARDANPQVRLRAVDLLLSLKSKDAPTSASRALGVDVARLTPSERTRLEALVAAVRAVYEEVWKRSPDQRPSWAPEPVDPPWPQQPSAPVTAPVATTAPDAPSVSELPDVEAEPGQLARHLWPSVGIFLQNGKVTHALGDDHAQAILDGRISLDDARQQHADAQRHDTSVFQRS